MWSESLGIGTTFLALLVQGHDMDVKVCATGGESQASHPRGVLWLWFAWTTPPKDIDGFKEAMLQGYREYMLGAGDLMMQA